MDFSENFRFHLIHDPFSDAVPIIKDFYHENPQIAAMTPEEIEDAR